MIDRYLNSLQRTRKEIGGFAVCPYLKKYRSKILSIKNNDIETVVKNYIEFRNAFELEAVVVEMEHCDYDSLESRVDRLNNKYTGRNITVLMMHPDTEEPPLPLEYNYDTPLVIIQNTGTLERARRDLKGSKYYDYYKND